MAMTFNLPELGENIETIQVAKVLVKAGDAVVVDQPLLELETDKATIEVPSSVAGTVARVLVSEGDEIKVGAAIMEFDDAVGAAAPAKPADAKPAPAEDQPAPAPVAAPAARVPAEDQPNVFPPTVSVPASPSVRRFAREIGMDLNIVKASGPHGRVSVDDVKRYARELNSRRPEASAPVPGHAAPPPLPDFAPFGAIEVEKMTAIRRKTAEHMALSWSQIPHVTIHDKADISELEPLRKQFAARAEALGGKLTMAVMVCKVVASALKVFPKFNASIDMLGRQTILKKYVNLGVAVSTDRGLMVPTIKDADRKNMVQMAAEITRIAQKARSGRIEIADMEGGTFTVTNLGRVGGVYFTPIVNYPEVAILGMGHTFEEAPADGKGGAARLMLPLSLSFDHRLIDGSEAAQFLGWIIEALQQPLVLALEG